MAERWVVAKVGDRLKRDFSWGIVDQDNSFAIREVFRKGLPGRIWQHKNGEIAQKKRYSQGQNCQRAVKNTKGRGCT